MSSSVKLKRQRPESVAECIICQDIKDVVLNPCPDSFKKFKSAASRRKDDVSFRFLDLYDPTLEKQKFSWHRLCYSSYTSKVNISLAESNKKQAKNDHFNQVDKIEFTNVTTNRIDNIESTSASTSASTPKVMTQKRISRLSIDDKNCIICGKANKNKNKTTFVLSHKDSAEKFLFAVKKKKTKFSHVSVPVKRLKIYLLITSYTTKNVINSIRTMQKKALKLQGGPCKFRLKPSM